MKIEIDEQKILTEVLERDGSVHQKIKEQIENRLVNQIEAEIVEKFYKKGWHGVTEEINNRVLEDLEEKQKKLVIEILKEFYNSYRYKKNNLEILKKLKDFIGESNP